MQETETAPLKSSRAQIGQQCKDVQSRQRHEKATIVESRDRKPGEPHGDADSLLGEEVVTSRCPEDIEKSQSNCDEVANRGELSLKKAPSKAAKRISIDISDQNGEGQRHTLCNTSLADPVENIDHLMTAIDVGFDIPFGDIQ